MSKGGGSFDFIFMLTRDDRTDPDALSYVNVALDLGVRHIGFKDIGATKAELSILNTKIKSGGARSYLEVVSLDRESELNSAQVAVEIGVDTLLGGTHVADVLPILEGSGIAYCPFPGRITGHPSRLEGSHVEITASAVELSRVPGVHGLDLLAYRAEGDIPVLMQAVCREASTPVIMAGSIDSPERIAHAKRAGAAGFTMGTALLTGQFPAPDRDLRTQLQAVLAVVDG